MTVHSSWFDWARDDDRVSKRTFAERRDLLLDYFFVQRRFGQLIPFPLIVITLALIRGPYDTVPGGHASVYAAAAVATAGQVLFLAFPLQEGWLGPLGLLAVCAAGGVLIVATQNSVLVVLPYLVASIAGRRCSMPAAMTLMLAALITILLTQQALKQEHIALVAELAILVAVCAGAFARRTRQDRIEEMELALAREQAAREEHARAATLAERTRIAREIHDVLAHSLSALSLNLQGTRLMLTRDGAGEDAIEQVRRAQKLAAEGLAEARRAVAALRDDPVPAARAIADLVTETRLETGAEAGFTLEGEPHDLPGPAENALFRTAQEALSNARKHAPGAEVRVLLRYLGDRTELTVTDHPGRRPTDAPPGGYGLNGMRERAELIGAELRTGPTDDGWRVDLVVPR
jgi:signal transduction histidine kinase